MKKIILSNYHRNEINRNTITFKSGVRWEGSGKWKRGSMEIFKRCMLEATGESCGITKIAIANIKRTQWDSSRKKRKIYGVFTNKKIKQITKSTKKSDMKLHC